MTVIDGRGIGLDVILKLKESLLEKNFGDEIVGDVCTEVGTTFPVKVVLKGQVVYVKGKSIVLKTSDRDIPIYFAVVSETLAEEIVKVDNYTYYSKNPNEREKYLLIDKYNRINHEYVEFMKKHKKKIYLYDKEIEELRKKMESIKEEISIAKQKENTNIQYAKQYCYVR